VAALLAREGFTGAPADTIEGEAVAVHWDDLGTRWRMLEQYFKPYPVCRWAQPAMEAAAQLRRDNVFDAATITALRVRTFREASLLAARRPKATDEAQYSLPFPLAALLVRGKVGPAEIEGAGLADADVLRLSERVDLREDARYSARFPAERWAEVEIDLADGRRLVSRPAVARGSAENPLSDAEISAKFHGLMRDSGYADRAAQIEDRVMTLEAAPNLAPLLDLVCEPLATRIASRGAMG
jgi:2-methylcitrate dehydratase PrpD